VYLSANCGVGPSLCVPFLQQETEVHLVYLLWGQHQCCTHAASLRGAVRCCLRFTRAALGADPLVARIAVRTHLL
jgi:hypothetical protein